MRETVVDEIVCGLGMTSWREEQKTKTELRDFTVRSITSVSEPTLLCSTLPKEDAC